MKQKRKPNQNDGNNRSALMLAGQNSLMINSNIMEDNKMKLTQSHVVSLYKRQNNNQQDYKMLDDQNSKSRKVYVRQPQKSQYSTPYYLDSNNKMKSHQIYDKSYMPRNANQSNTMQKIAKSRYYTQDNQNYKESEFAGKNYQNEDYYRLNSQNQQSLEQFNTKKIMMKLTLPRLRKMQALVRGFLVRRKVYPKVLQEYLVAQSVLSLIQANVIYKESSSILLQTITFPKYQGGLRDFIGDQQMLQNVLYDKIIERVIQKQLPQIVQDSIIQKGVLMSRPQITFGLNIRSPVQLLLYQKLMNQINYQLKQICEEAIRQEAAQKRELLIIDDWIVKYDMLNSLYKQIVDECLEQNVGGYVVQSILQRINLQACFVLCQNTYNKAVLDWYNQQMDLLTEEVEQLLFQQLVSCVVIENMQRHNQKSDFLND